MPETKRNGAGFKGIVGLLTLEPRLARTGRLPEVEGAGQRTRPEAKLLEGRRCTSSRGRGQRR